MTIGSAVISATIIDVNTSVLAALVEVTPVPSLGSNEVTVSCERMSVLQVKGSSE